MIPIEINGRIFNPYNITYVEKVDSRIKIHMVSEVFITGNMDEYELNNKMEYIKKCLE